MTLLLHWLLTVCLSVVLGQRLQFRIKGASHRLLCQAQSRVRDTRREIEREASESLRTQLQMEGKRCRRGLSVFLERACVLFMFDDTYVKVSCCGKFLTGCAHSHLSRILTGIYLRLLHCICMKRVLHTKFDQISVSCEISIVIDHYEIWSQNVGRDRIHKTFVMVEIVCGGRVRSR